LENRSAAARPAFSGPAWASCWEIEASLKLGSQTWRTLPRWGCLAGSPPIISSSTKNSVCAQTGDGPCWFRSFGGPPFAASSEYPGRGPGAICRQREAGLRPLLIVVSGDGPQTPMSSPAWGARPSHADPTPAGGSTLGCWPNGEHGLEALTWRWPSTPWGCRRFSMTGTRSDCHRVGPTARPHPEVRTDRPGNCSGRMAASWWLSGLPGHQLRQCRGTPGESPPWAGGGSGHLGPWAWRAAMGAEACEIYNRVWPGVLSAPIPARVAGAQLMGGRVAANEDAWSWPKPSGRAVLPSPRTWRSRSQLRVPLVVALQLE